MGLVLQNIVSIEDLKKQRIFLYTGLFLVWPFGSAMAALKFNKEPFARNIFWFFCIFFGYTFIIDTELADSARYAQAFFQYGMSNFTFRDLLGDLYSGNTLQMDIYQPLLTYIVARLTRNVSIYFAVIALVFGYFYSRNIWFILDRIRNKRDFSLYLFITVFVLLNPIWNINGFRMYTAIHVFLFGALPFLMDKKKSGLLWAISSVFFHFSLIIPVALLIGFAFLPKKISLFYWFFIITSFIKEVDLMLVRDLLSMLPDVIFYRFESYTDISYAEDLADMEGYLNWYVLFVQKSVIFVVYGMATYIYLFGRHLLGKNKKMQHLFCFALLMFGFANLLSLIPSGHRFLVVANLFMYAFLILYIRGTISIVPFRLFRYFTMPFLLIFIVVTMRIGMDYYGLLTIIGNPILSFFVEESIPLVEYFK